MSTTVGSPIYYGYNGSPFVSKLETILLLKNIPARRVDVALYPPRPELADLLGLPYRRVPVLALGRDVYVDTSLIASVLEKSYPAPQHPTIFPPRKGSGSIDTGLQITFAHFYTDKVLFNLGFELLPWTRTPAHLQADRKKFMGREIDFEQMAKQWPTVHSKLISHLALYEEQLRDEREWFLDTETPGLADISVYFVLTWIRSFRNARPIFDADQFPRTVAWLDRTDALVNQKLKASPHPITKISGSDAAKEILSSSFLDVADIGFDDVEAKRLGIKLGGIVSVWPDDTGKDVGTVGKVVGLDRTEIVLETEAARGGPDSIRVHFPRLGYVLKESAPQAKL